MPDGGIDLNTILKVMKEVRDRPGLTLGYTYVSLYEWNRLCDIRAKYPSEWTREEKDFVLLIESRPSF